MVQRRSATFWVSPITEAVGLIRRRALSMSELAMIPALVSLILGICGARQAEAGFPKTVSAEATEPWAEAAVTSAEVAVDAENVIRATSVETSFPAHRPLDIRPGACPNRFGRFFVIGESVLPVSLLGTATFDVNDVDPDTVRLALAGHRGRSIAPSEAPVVADTGTPDEGEP